MAEEYGIYEATKKYLDSLADDDLLDLGLEINRQHDRSCTWAWTMDVSEEMYMRAESAAYERSTRAVLEAMEWAQSVKGYDLIDEDGDPVSRDDLLERARDNIDELADCVVDDIDWNGTPEVYMAIDTDELLAEWQKTSEWQEEYGEEEDE